MAINPVALGVQVPKFDNPMEIYGNALKLQSMQQQNALAQSQMADLERERSQNAFLNDAYSRAIDPQTGKVNYNALTLELARGGQGSLVPGIRETESKGREADFKARKAEQDYALQFLEATRQQLQPGMSLESVLAISRANHSDPVIGPLLKRMGIDQNKTEADTIAAFNAGRGDEHILAMAMGAKDFANSIKMLDLGGEYRPQYPGGRVGDSTTAIQKVPTISEKETARHNQEMEKNAQDRGVDINAYPNLYQAIEDGRIPLTRVNSRTAAIFEGVLARNPDADLNDISLDQTSATAGARTAGTTKANIGIASDEANRMIQVTRGLIPAVKNANITSLNALKNLIARGTGDPNIVALNTSLNSLINSYARAINPKGVATVSDKNHARDLIDSAMSNGQLDAALNVMQQEMEAALGAARAGSGSQKPAAGAAPTNGPVKITSDAQFEKLPSGTLFIGPDGKQRRKQ